MVRCILALIRHSNTARFALSDASVRRLGVYIATRCFHLRSARCLADLILVILITLSRWSIRGSTMTNMGVTGALSGRSSSCRSVPLVLNEVVVAGRIPAAI
jgi:hypothetical protein